MSTKEKREISKKISKLSDEIVVVKPGTKDQKMIKTHKDACCGGR